MHVTVLSASLVRTRATCSNNISLKESNSTSIPPVGLNAYKTYLRDAGTYVPTQDVKF